jgi:hypothetical protein
MPVVSSQHPHFEKPLAYTQHGMVSNFYLPGASHDMNEPSLSNEGNELITLNK